MLRSFKKKWMTISREVYIQPYKLIVVCSDAPPSPRPLLPYIKYGIEINHIEEGITNDGYVDKKLF